MTRDERGLPLSTDSAEAAALFDRAVEHFLKYHADVMTLASRMLAADPEFVMGHCFKGYMLLAASDPAHWPAIAATLAAAETGAPVATERERKHVAALKIRWRGWWVQSTARKSGPTQGRLIDDRRQLRSAERAPQRMAATWIMS